MNLCKYVLKFEICFLSIKVCLGFVVIQQDLQQILSMDKCISAL